MWWHFRVGNVSLRHKVTRIWSLIDEAWNSIFHLRNFVNTNISPRGSRQNFGSRFQPLDWRVAWTSKFLDEGSQICYENRGQSLVQRTMPEKEDLECIFWIGKSTRIPLEVHLFTRMPLEVPNYPYVQKNTLYKVIIHQIYKPYLPKYPSDTNFFT